MAVLRSILLLTIVVVAGRAHAQQDSAMLAQEDELIALRNAVLAASLPADKDSINDQFVALLIDVLKQPGSYAHPFDSLPQTGALRSPDGAFRMINWNLNYRNNTYRYFCFIQYPSKDRGMVVYELNDISGSQRKPLSTSKVYDADRWYGALYYEIIPVKRRRKTRYTLLGWDGHNGLSSKKIIDVMQLSSRKAPRFGAPLFKVPRRSPRRVIFEYASEVTMSVRYQERHKRIVFDHLSPTQPHLSGQRQFYAPDASFDAFRLKKGKWVLVTDVDVRQEREDRIFNTP